MAEMLQSLADIFPLRSSDQQPNDTPHVMQPIDTGCIAILNHIREAVHNPLDVSAVR